MPALYLNKSMAKYGCDSNLSAVRMGMVRVRRVALAAIIAAEAGETP